MNQPIEVSFDFALDDSNFIISIRANAKFCSSDKYYHVYDFHANGSGSERPSIFPEQEIMKVENGNSSIWVHRDSQMESSLSRAIGKSLENALKLNGI